VATTIYLNVAGEHDPVAAVAHGVLPGLWVIAVEAGSHVVRTHVGLTSSSAVERMDRVRLSRWVLAPASTLRLWRRMVLWETRSYSEALHRERARLLARTELQDRWGTVMWRWRAPRRERALYRLGDLAPATALAPAAAEPVQPAPALSTRRPSRRRPAPSARVDDRELVAAARHVADELAARGEGLTRSSLVAGLRTQGLAVSNARAGALLAGLRSDGATTTEGEQ
jgi:hypothetical protein